MKEDNRNLLSSLRITLQRITETVTEIQNLLTATMAKAADESAASSLSTSFSRLCTFFVSSFACASITSEASSAANAILSFYDAADSRRMDERRARDEAERRRRAADERDERGQSVRVDYFGSVVRSKRDSLFQ